MTIETLLQQMKRLRTDMVVVSTALKKAGYAEHGEEMSGAAKMLKTWINGIGKENP